MATLGALGVLALVRRAVAVNGVIVIFGRLSRSSDDRHRRDVHGARSRCGPYPG